LQVRYGSIGSIGKGLEDISNSISSLSTKESSAIADVNTKINKVISQTYASAASILNTRIVNLENDLDEINKEIEDVYKEITLESQKCEEFSDCSGCTANSNCV
jgi:LMP repeated region.